MQIDGALTLDGRRLPVSGEGWMDRECGRFAFDDRLFGWDWFGVQLDEGCELMVYHLRDADGRTLPQTHAVVVDADGTSHPLTVDEFHLSPRESWTSRRTGCEYPVSWTLSIPRYGADLSIEPFMRNHELDTLSSTSLIYWEGPAAVRGMWRGRPAAGRCFAELVGYDQHRRGDGFDFNTRNFGLVRFLNSEYHRWSTRAGIVNTD
jgi:predicted secreted hydrolase